MIRIPRGRTEKTVTHLAPEVKEWLRLKGQERGTTLSITIATILEYAYDHQDQFFTTDTHEEK